MPAAKRYIVYPETIQGAKDLNIDMRRKTRAGRSSHSQIVLGGGVSLPLIRINCILAIIQKLHFQREKTKAHFPKEPKIPLKSKDIYPQRGFRAKIR